MQEDKDDEALIERIILCVNLLLWYIILYYQIKIM